MKFKKDVTAQMYHDANVFRGYLQCEEKGCQSAEDHIRHTHPEWLEPEVRPCVCCGKEFVHIQEIRVQKLSCGLTDVEACKSCGTVRIKI